MANSRFYDATKEDSRSWRDDSDIRTSAADEASQDNADALQDETRATNPIDGISVTPATATIDLSDEETAQLTVAGTVDGDPSTAGFQVTWTSSDVEKATVDESGLVTPVATGTSTITATCVHDDTITDTCAITVVA